jgi:imidazolonepropionase-like amidohydrolase
MKNALLFLLVCLMPLEVFGRQEAGSGRTAFVFTHVTVIDATGAPAKPDMSVVVKGDRIEALGKTSKLAIPRNAQVVDATGKFLIPGLWDMHIHPLNNKNHLTLFIANGVTGVRVMRGEPVHHKWRQEISAGKLIGPRMVIASPFIDGPDPLLIGSIIVSNEDEGRQVIRKVKKEGADFIKVFNGIPPEAYFAIADEAKKQGIPFAGHVPYLVSAAEASDAGQQSIEHCYFVLLACSNRDEEELKKKLKETLETLVANPSSLRHMSACVKLLTDTIYSEKKAAALFARFVKNGTWVCPTLMLYHSVSFRDEEDLVNDPRLKYMPLSTRDSWKDDVYVAWAIGEGQADHKKLCEKRLAIVSAMNRAGVGLLAGTDTTGATYCFPGFGLHDELAVFVQAGLSPLEALQTATYNPAKCLGKLDSMGTIEQGKVADLVLLDADPLQDIRNTQKIAAVVVGGKIFDKTALHEMLAQVEAIAKKSKNE